MENTNLGGGLPQQGPGFQGLPSALSKKWIFAVAAVVLIVLFVAVFSLSQRGSSSSTATNQNVPEPTSNFQATGPEPTFAPDVQKAVSEAQQAAVSYDEQQSAIREDYPWLRKLPLNGEKFFVFFDLDTGRFTGKLYPAAGDNPEQIKTDALRELRGKGVPIEKFQFDWTTTPQ